jgi:ABC-type Na+ efflux pump permease subunit
MSDKEHDRPNKPEEPGKLNWLQVLGSVFAAGLGVQSSKNRERDFKHGRTGVFIAAGIVFTLLFVGLVMLVVQMVLKSAGE